MAITVKEVALRAGVSPITVSRTFSGTHPVAEETRQRVLTAAAELGYAPDLLAQGMVRKQLPIVGVVVLELANPFFAPIIDAVQAVARRHDHMVIVNQSERSPQLEQSSLIQLRQLRVAGVLATPAATDLTHLRALQLDGTAVVLVARRWDAGHYVAIDDEMGGWLAGEHLVRLGHRRIACVTLDEPHNPSYRARIRGFQNALAEGGVSEVCTLLTETQRLEDGRRAADAFLECADPPTAAFVNADRMAIGFVHRLRQRGVRVPDDVAVVGYDDIRYAEFMEVPLTTVALPKYDMGARAAEILFYYITDKHGAHEPQQILLQPRLIVRASCGA